VAKLVSLIVIQLDILMKITMLHLVLIIPKKVIKYPDAIVRLQLWDIAGQDRFASLTRPYYRGAKAAIVFCDVTRPATITAIEIWKKELDEKFSENPIPII